MSDFDQFSKMPRFDVNSLTNDEMISHMVANSPYRRKYIKENISDLWQWLAINVVELYWSSDPYATHQMQTARKGDNTNKCDSSDEEDDEEATTSDEEFIENDLVESEGEYVPSDEGNKRRRNIEKTRPSKRQRKH